jgi:hypothetical protein
MGGGARVVPDDELPYVRPQEWVNLLDRLRFNVGSGKKKLGSKTIKGIAVRLAWYADYTYGTGVYPGLARTAVGCEVDYDTVKKVFAVLRELRLLTLVKKSRGPQGRRRAEVADEYRLTIPPDLLDLKKVAVVEPEQFEKEISALRDGKRGQGVAGVRHPPNSPVDNYLPLELQGCSTPVSEPLVEKVAGVLPPADEKLQGCCPESYGGAAPLPTTKELALTTNTPPPVPARPLVTRARSRARASKPDADSEAERCDHGLTVGERPDGTSTCPLCRRTPVAKVIPLHPDRSAS